MNTNEIYSVPTQSSSDAEWMSWFTALNSYFGRKAAGTLFAEAWAKNSSDAANTEALRAFAKKNNLTVDAGVVGSIVDFGSGVMDYIGDFFMLGKYAAIGLAVVMVGGIGMVVFNLAKNPHKTIQTAATVAKVAAI